MNERAAQHVATCKVCTAVIAHPETEDVLRRAAEALAAPANLPDPWPSLQATLAQEHGLRARLQALPRSWAAMGGMGIGMGVVLVVSLLMPGPHWERWSLARQLAILLGGGLCLGTGMAFASRSVFNAPRALSLWGLGCSMVMLGALLALAPQWLPNAEPLAPAPRTAELLRGVARCLAFGALCCVPLIIWLGASRRWQPARPARRFAVATLIALCGMLALEIHCPAMAPLHRMLGHAALAPLLGTFTLGAAWAMARLPRFSRF